MSSVTTEGASVKMRIIRRVVAINVRIFQNERFNIELSKMLDRILNYSVMCTSEQLLQMRPSLGIVQQLDRMGNFHLLINRCE